ncbi:hypothetical protein CJ030_MR6G018054 [Morella rubra]|uniref:Uncharacterized protein n=1 Tax=Morella rubra TaxID=262757 RepID=A0A6A1VGY0_9ROSI|nr:hypothetical protein CJ030_MR6G018054 [Morella rubra]
MKAFFIACILMASLIFLPSSLAARELSATEVVGGSIDPGNRNKPTVPCGPGKRYRSCLPGGAAPSPKRCTTPYKRNCP